MTRNEAIEILNEALELLKVEESAKEQLILEAREYVDPAIVRTGDPIGKIIEMANIIGRLLLYVK